MSIEENLPPPLLDTSSSRILSMLASALTPEVGALLLDPEVIEVMINPDGKLWVDRLGKGRMFTGYCIEPKDAERVIYIVAASCRQTCSKENPIISAELPGTGSRFQGMLPPVCSPGPAITIRMKASKVFTIDEYVEAQIMSKNLGEFIKKSVVQKKNILVAGGTGSGKTTLVNGVLDEIGKTGDRLVILEDTQELQSKAKDTVLLQTSAEVTMTHLLKATMRLRPDRIVVGEVRGEEALDLLRAWNTGHPGGCCTVHADSAVKALSRLEQLVFEAGLTHSKSLIADAVDIIMFIEKTKSSRIVSEVIEVDWRNESYKLTSIS